MKILRLDLLAFGPFSGVSLAFDQGQHGLHIVHGHNEAGKSSSLRALRDWLYGIPRISTDNFLHSNPNMRIGGVLENARGERLEFIRRKANAKTMRQADDTTPIDETLLANMLGGVDQRAFCQQFGIDYQELRRGGDSIVQGGGDLGEMLFAAGAGLASLRKIQQQLKDEIDQLFKSGGAKPKINEAISRLNTARNDLKKALVPTEEWNRHDEALRVAERRRQELDSQLQEKRQLQSQLQRIEKALPLISDRQRLQEELAPLAGAPRLPDNFAAQRSTEETRLNNANELLESAQRKIESLQNRIGEVKEPGDFLQHRAEIDRINNNWGAIAKAANDRPNLEAEALAAERKAQEHLRDLGREPEFAQADSLRLPAAQRERIQSLANDCKARVDRQASVEQDVEKILRQIQDAQTELAGLSEAQEIRNLEAAVREIQTQGKLDQIWAEAKALLGKLVDQGMVDLKALTLWHGTLDDLERLPVPAHETVDRFERELSEAQKKVEKIQERIDDSLTQRRQVDERLQKLQLERDVPTEEDLQRARERRETGWRLVRGAWRQELPENDAGMAEFVNEVLPGGTLDEAFYAIMKAADEVADRLRREANRVAEKAELTAKREEHDQRLDEERERKHDAQQALEQLQSKWCALWAPLDIEPLSPREMLAWIVKQKSLAEDQREIRQQQQVVEKIGQQIQSCLGMLNQSLCQLGQDAAGENESLSAVLVKCEQVIEQARANNQHRKTLEAGLGKLRNDLAGAQDKAKRAQAELLQWKQDWAEAIAALGMDADARPNEVNRVIGTIDELLESVRESQGLRKRIADIDADAANFGRSLQDLLTKAAPDLLELPSAAAVDELNQRLTQAVKDQASLDGWHNELREQTELCAKARADRERCLKALAAMCRQAGCDAPDDLPEVEQQSSQRKKIETDLKSVNEQLRMLAAPLPPETFIAQAERSNPDEVAAQLKQLESEIHDGETQRSAAAERVGEHRNELERMDGNGGAAEVQEQSEYLLAQIRSDAEHFIRLKLAAAILHKSIDRYREAAQGPVLERASELFRELTLGSFAGLRADFDDNGRPVVNGVRARDESLVAVKAMSDGTCDQLYLALRLAMLESSLKDREPIPFIVDDILIMFDDRRAIAALKAFAELSRTTQVIFFTHHEHLIELAGEAVDRDALFVHELKSA